MEIVEWAALDPYRGGVFHSDQRTLLACSLVSRLWRTHAQRILFRKVRIKATDDELLFKSAFDSFIATLVSLHVRKSTLPLEVTALSLGCQSAYFATTTDLSSVPNALRLLPRLRALHITLLAPDLEIPDLFSFDDTQMRCLRAVACTKTITHLSMRSHISDPLILQQLLATLPHIRTLTLEAPRHSTTYAKPIELPALRTLVIDAAISRKCLAYLYSCTMPSLRSLSLATLNDLARVHAHFMPYVRDLAVFDAAWDASESDLYDCIIDLPKLERVVLGFDVPRDLLDRLPSGITSFGFDPYVIGSVDDVLEWLEGRPFVRTVGIVFHPELDDERETPARARVKRFCADTDRRLVELYRMHHEELPDVVLTPRSDTMTPECTTPRAQCTPR
ncbi:hypothetical protein EXIGLDRAFT_717776 [Exidia glandulosa HHB12029]|uniref:F-box domain-containing protein n=1 Tax=Exidia glandulosa HHB12029 TaxID=1314781 RepID=A0A165I5F8_EXIGL|nr:hypothetical protein EXIGLDRAFT_717776 [Exidia glandulosa HHB12029]